MASAATAGGDRQGPTCVLVDDHEAVRSSLATLLEQESFRVVGEAGTAAAAVTLLETLEPCFAVLDYHLPDGTGVGIALEATTRAPRTKLILYTGDAPASAVREALAVGVQGVVLKDVPPTRLLHAIDAVLAGEQYVDPHFGIA